MEHKRRIALLGALDDVEAEDCDDAEQSSDIHASSEWTYVVRRRMEDTDTTEYRGCPFDNENRALSAKEYDLAEHAYALLEKGIDVESVQSAIHRLRCTAA